MAAKRGLGSGVNALFSNVSEPESSPPGGEEILQLPISRVEPRAGQPRYNFDGDALAELAESIKQYGLIQPITVRRLDGGYYQIIAGERRWRASRIAGLTEIPARVIEADERKATELALVENLQREDLNPIEEARGYKTLMDEFGMTQDQAAQSVGKSRPAVTNALRLLSLSDAVLKMVENGSLSAGHARALVPLKEPATQLEAARAVVDKRLSVRQTEAMVAALLSRRGYETDGAEEENSGKVVVDYVREMEHKLENALGRKVKLVDSRKKGRIELEFYGADDRESLIENLLLFAKMRGNK